MPMGCAYSTRARRFELRIGSDAKFKWHDCTKDKAIRAMPKAIDETKSMLKEQAKILERGTKPD